jgi:hypothetical protein
MAIDIYWAGLLVLLPSAALLIGKDAIVRVFRHFLGRDSNGRVNPTGYSPEKNEEAKKFRRTFLQVYLLVMSGEWLQVREPQESNIKRDSAANKPL